jgi:hypothetical protein
LKLKEKKCWLFFLLSHISFTTDTFFNSEITIFWSKELFHNHSNVLWKWIYWKIPDCGLLVKFSGRQTIKWNIWMKLT